MAFLKRIKEFAKLVRENNPTLTDCFFKQYKNKGKYWLQLIDPSETVVIEFDTEVGVGKKNFQKVIDPLAEELDYTLHDHGIHVYRDAEEWEKWRKSSGHLKRRVTL